MKSQKGIIKFCYGEDVVRQRIYNSIEHREQIISQYSLDGNVVFDSIIYSPGITVQNTQKIVNHLKRIGAYNHCRDAGLTSIKPTTYRCVTRKVIDGSGRIYNNLKEAADTYKLNAGSASQMIRGKRNNRYGFRYYEKGGEDEKVNIDYQAE